MSRESEKLFEAIGHASDGQIEESQGPRRRRKLRWAAPLAAVIALAILLTVVLTGPGRGSAYAVAEAKYPKERLTRVPPVAAGMMEGFLRRSLPVLLAGQEGENRVCSPLNIYMALSMLAETAGGESRAQVLDLLGAEDMESQRERARQLWERSYLPAEDRYGACLLASSLWLDSGIPYKRETAELLAEEYYASVFQGDLGSEKLNEALRGWLNAQTGGLLAEQAAQAALPTDTALALAATLYFKGNWANEFEKSDTAPRSFYGPGGERTVDFMHGEERGMYYRGESFTAAAKGFTNARSMLFVLPEEGLTPEALLSEEEFMDFLAGDRSAWEGKAEATVRYALPRFDVAETMDLLSVLADLGVTDVLDPALADFSPIMDVPAALTKAEHACRVKVDEEGCEAAAYTLMGYGGGMIVELEEVDFILDRPFLFAVLNQEGRPLFVGIVNDPAA